MKEPHIFGVLLFQGLNEKYSSKFYHHWSAKNSYHFPLSLFKAAPEKLNENLKKELTDKYYKADILQLEKLIEKDLSHWL